MEAWKQGNSLLLCFLVSLLPCFLLNINNAFAFNEFQQFIEAKSGKQLNCAYCHAHTNGPEGREEGQLETLSEEEKSKTAYNQFLRNEGRLQESPILNDFGNYLVAKLGYEALVKAQGSPELLLDSLETSDLDKDGIADKDELLNGTLPNDPLDGRPLRLFINNLKKKYLEILFQIVTIFMLIISILKMRI